MTWYELGSTGSLKALAFKDSASGKITPAGNLTVDAGGALTVDFSEATFTGTESAYTGSLTINAVTGVNGTFTGDDATLSADVTAPTSSWTVDFTKVSVENAVTGVASVNAIKGIPELSTSSGHGITQQVSLDVSPVYALTSYDTGNITVPTDIGGKTTTFSGTYTPSGSINLSTLGVALNSGTGRPTGTGGFFNSASVDNQVLSFGSGEAVTGLTADVLTEVTFSGLTGSAAFSGASADISASGVPQISSDSSTMTFVISCDNTTYSGLTASGSFTNDNVLTSFQVGYSGNPTYAALSDFVLACGTVTGKGSQGIEYAPPKKEISISYKPSGSVVVNDFTPTGSVTTTVKPAGSIAGSQSIAAHTHTATFSGTEATVTVS